MQETRSDRHCVLRVRCEAFFRAVLADQIPKAAGIILFLREFAGHPWKKVPAWVPASRVKEIWH